MFLLVRAISVDSFIFKPFVSRFGPSVSGTTPIIEFCKIFARGFLQKNSFFFIFFEKTIRTPSVTHVVNSLFTQSVFKRHLCNKKNRNLSFFFVRELAFIKTFIKARGLEASNYKEFGRCLHTTLQIINLY